MLEHFENSLKIVNFYLGLFGLAIKRRDNKSILGFVRSYWIYIAHFSSFNLEVVAQIWWGFEAIITRKKFVEITRLVPCMVICIASLFKTLSILYYQHDNNEFIESMKGLLVNQMDVTEEERCFKKKVIDSHVSILRHIHKKAISLITLGLIMFSLAPVFTIVPEYLRSSEVKLELPFIAYYPFNEFDIRYFPLVYIHQCISGT
uniref:Odorant receptor 9 n=1 Tax=Athetis dissimilis TaxID=1737331 RepID=A0A0S1TS42_ATHDI|nr:odorant receptor 9 [Athetis dissimilis]